MPSEFTGVSNSSTESSVFPQFFCNPCHSKLKCTKKASEDGVPFHSIVPVEWSPHVENCQVGLKYLRLTLIIITIIIIILIISMKKRKEKKDGN